MNILKIVENIYCTDNTNYSNSCITRDRKMLCLSYPMFDSKETGFDEYFDKLDLEEQIYDKVETLILESDFIYEIPNNVLKFKNLKKINVVGSRFWNLESKQIPASVEILYLTEHTNQCYQPYF